MCPPGSDRFSGQRQAHRTDEFDKPVDSLTRPGVLQAEHGPLGWRVPGPHPEDRASTGECVERGQFGRKGQWFPEASIEYAGAESHSVGDYGRSRKSSEGSGRRTEMIRNIEAVEARVIGGLGQLDPLSLIGESTLESDVNTLQVAGAMPTTGSFTDLAPMEP